MRPQHHVQPLTNPPGHAQEPHERYRCKTTTTKPAAATHHLLATETTLGGAQKPSKTVGLGASTKCLSSMGIFHFSDEALKGARKRRGKPRLDQHMCSNLEGVAAKSANQEGNKVARSGREIEQNEVPKPGPQNRQFCGDAWACPHGRYRSSPEAGRKKLTFVAPWAKVTLRS